MKIKTALLLLFMILLVSSAACAEESAGALDFVPRNGGRFIYSSNPENILDENLAESGSMLDNYNSLDPGTYTYMAWYHNGTDGKIRADVLFNTLDRAEIRINRLGLQVFPLKNSPAWTGLQAYADFLGSPIENPFDADENNPPRYDPKELDLPQTITLAEPKRSVWLSDIYESAFGADYPLMTDFNTPIYIIMEFEVLSGSPSLSTIAYRAGSDKTSFLINSAPYVQDVEVSKSSSASPTWKGMAEAAAAADADINYTIDENEPSDAFSLSFDVNGPFGTTETSKWITHLNPQNDIFAFRSVPESSMPAFEYNDGSLWRFDTRSTPLRVPPDGLPDQGFEPNGPLPDLSLPPGDIIQDGYFKGMKKQQISLSQGNYSLANIYNLLITNNTDDVWKINYRTDSASGVVVGVSANGERPVYTGAGSLGFKAFPRFVGPTIEIPPRETVRVIITVTLTTGDNGGITNELFLSRKY